MAAFGDLPALVPLVQKWRQLQNVGATAHLPVQVAEELYGRELETSVSALEDFAACPFKFFAVRGLRLEERKKFQFDDRDKGSFQHEVLREFHERVRTTGRMWRHLGVVEARVMVTNLAHDLLSQFEHGKFQADGAARFMGQLLIERVGDLVEALIGWMAQYEFDPALAEISFGLESDGLPAWRLRLAEGRALKLRGRIDRVDVHRSDDDTALAVVMDYKSSARRLHPAKLYHGLELQLLSYLGVLRHVPNPERFFGVKQVSPVGVFFVPLNGGANRRTLTRAEVVAEDAIERRASYQHSGRFLAEALEHFDNRRTVRGDQFRYARKQDGSLSACGSEALPSLEFEGLREKAEGFLSDYGGRILAGEVAVSPFRIGQQTACERCDFRAVCRFDPWTQPYRNLGPAPKSA
jgi:ATP-dependent helicase/nuclease subunit B